VDDRKRAAQKELGPGGMKCACCAPPPGKDRKALLRRARRRQNQQDQKRILEDTQCDTD